METLKAKYDGEWWLVLGPEFTKKELEPLKDAMKRFDLAILGAGDRVRVGKRQYEKEDVLKALRESE